MRSAVRAYNLFPVGLRLVNFELVLFGWDVRIVDLLDGLGKHVLVKYPVVFCEVTNCDDFGDTVDFLCSVVG